MYISIMFSIWKLIIFLHNILTMHIVSSSIDTAKNSLISINSTISYTITVSPHMIDTMCYNCTCKEKENLKNKMVYEFSLKTTFKKAHFFCSNRGTSMCLPTDLESLEDLKQKMEASKIEHVYVGIHDIFEEGSFITVKGKPFVPGVLQWRVNPDQPDNMNNEDCVVMNRKGYLSDIDCAAEHYYTCCQNYYLYC